MAVQAKYLPRGFQSTRMPAKIDGIMPMGCKTKMREVAANASIRCSELGMTRTLPGIGDKVSILVGIEANKD